ncbi:MAG: S49 family peptidase [Planctomycetota bacterium]|jgi:signal peptide peptidase SppA
MDQRDSYIQEYLTTHRWALQRQVLDSLCSVIERHISGEKLSEEQIKLITSSRRTAEDPRKYEFLADGTAVIHISGVIAKYSHMVNGCSQPRGTSVEFLSQQLSLAMADARVKKIFFRIESPGGTMPGLPDFADQVYQASFEKPIIAFADDHASSAAYWIGSQANAFYSNQSAMVGSIGVYTVVPDYSKQAEMLGIKFNVISTGDIKGAGYPGSQVTEEQLAAFAENIDDDFRMFLAAVLRGRSIAGLDEETLLEAADGRQFSARIARDKKLIDAVMTLDAALAMDAPAVRESVTAASAENHNENLIRKGNIMSENQVQTPADAADETKQSATGAEQERSRILAIQSALSDAAYEEIATKAIAEGWEIQQAKAAAFDVANEARTADKKAADGKIAEMQARLDAIAKSGHAEDLAAAPDTTPDTPLKGQQPVPGAPKGNAEAFNTAVEGYINAGMSKANAMAKAARENPANHRAWIHSIQQDQKSAVK